MAYESIQVRLSLTFAALSTVGWIVLLFQSEGWIKKITLFYTVDAGLTSVRVSQGVVSAAAGSVVALMSPELRRQLEQMQMREYGLQEFREYICQLPLLDACAPWEHVQISSWVLLVVMILSLVAYTIGAGLDYHYHFHKAREVNRWWANMLYLNAPLAMSLANLQYVLFASEVRNMQPVDNSMPIGPNLWKAVLLLICSWIPAAVSYYLGGNNLAEELNEMLAEKKKQAREEKLGVSNGMQGFNYGSAQTQAASGFHVNGGNSMEEGMYHGQNPSGFGAAPTQQWQQPPQQPIAGFQAFPAQPPEFQQPGAAAF